MKKVIIGFLIVLIIIGVYVLVRDIQIKKELSNVEQSQFVEQKDDTNNIEIDSEILLKKVKGVWSAYTTGEYTIDPASISLEFTGYKPGGEHVGVFNTAEVIVSLDKSGVPVRSNMILDSTSIQTDSPKLDEHLQAPEFFDAAQYPEVRVVVKQITQEGDSVKAITDITMKGITKTLAIPVNVKIMSDAGVQFTVDTRIKISDYNIAYGPVLDEVRITASGVLKKK